MREVRAILLLFPTIVFVPGLLAYGQGEPSLGDLARQARQQKPQSDASDKEARASKAARLISDQEVPERAAEPARPSHPDDQSRRISGATSAPKDAKTSAEQWKSKILAQKHLVSSLQSDLDKFESSIRFEPAKSSGSSARWNERQREKLQQVEQMRTRLEDQKKHLVDLQESARREGYGNSVYDP